jgi:hypothetical protein
MAHDIFPNFGFALAYVQCPLTVGFLGLIEDEDEGEPMRSGEGNARGKSHGLGPRVRNLSYLIKP